tara:strand:- start:748 stop:1479 length:732 start_codon:yes stop_codon:yes gene_type:complete
MKKLYKEDLWNKILEEVELFSNDQTMEYYFKNNILNFNNLSDALSLLISKNLKSQEVHEDNIIHDVGVAFKSKDIIHTIEEDINEICHKDPACNYFFQPLLFYKGFHALQAYRVANYWVEEKLSFSLYIQSIVSEKFNVDIHPNAKMGKGIMVDHASGVVIGETAIVGDYSSIFHGVTLGGVGSEKGQRHPQVGKNVLLSANSTIVGNIKIGDNAKIGAGSVVLNDIPKDCTAVGVPAKVINN